ncbi:MAG: RcnB family protein [Sphingomicrobium sp.]
MRTSLVFLLLASAAVPAFAAQGDEERTSRREAREEARADRQAEPQAERAQRPERSEPEAQDRSFEPRHEDRPQIVQQQAEVVQERVVETSTSRRSGGDSARPAFEQRMVQSESSPSAEPPRPAMDQRRDSIDSVREWRRHERNADNAPAAIEQQVAPADNAREWRGRERRVGNGSADNAQPNGTLGNGSFREPRREPTGRDSIGNRRGPMFGGIPRQGTQPPLPNSSQQATANQLSRVSAQHWRNNWRSDHHYDWQNHRHRHGSLFHLGFYFDPFGWGYQRYSIGSRLWPNYYRSSYWLNDPWQYRLPYAPPGYRWIRYYDDAVLVDTWDGQVVDVIYNFFW